MAYKIKSKKQKHLLGVRKKGNYKILKNGVVKDLDTGGSFNIETLTDEEHKRFFENNNIH